VQRKAHPSLSAEVVSRFLLSRIYTFFLGTNKYTIYTVAQKELVILVTVRHKSFFYCQSLQWIHNKVVNISLTLNVRLYKWAFSATPPLSLPNYMLVSVFYFFISTFAQSLSIYPLIYTVCASFFFPSHFSMILWIMSKTAISSLAGAGPSEARPPHVFLCVKLYQKSWFYWYSTNFVTRISVQCTLELKRHALGPSWGSWLPWQLKCAYVDIRDLNCEAMDTFLINRDQLPFLHPQSPYIRPSICIATNHPRSRTPLASPTYAQLDIIAYDDAIRSKCVQARFSEPIQ